MTKLVPIEQWKPQHKAHLLFELKCGRCGQRADLVPLELSEDIKKLARCKDCLSLEAREQERNLSAQARVFKKAQVPLLTDIKPLKRKAWKAKLRSEAN
jgi:hypothetical protein